MVHDLKPAARSFSALALAAALLILPGCGGGGGGGGGFGIGGTASGLSGTLVLLLNGGNDLSLTQNGAFTFGTTLSDGSSYSVTIASQPQDQLCTVSNSSGTVQGADVSNVAVACGAYNVSVSGTIQKGPFRNGSTVTIVELDSQLVPSGRQFTESTSNDLGHFETTAAIAAPFVRISTQGFFFDEIGNKLSNAQITLRTVSQYAEGETINVNLLTQLASLRVERLLASGAAATFGAALTQAQGEVLEMFGVTASTIPDFDTLDITGTGPGNAILIAASALLVQAATTASPSNMAGILSEMMANIGSDFRDDGVLNDTLIIDQVRQAGIDMDVAAVRANLEGEYAELGQTLTAAPFEDYIDRDGDGILPIDGDDDTPDPFTITPATGIVFPLTLHTSNIITITGIQGNVRVELSSGTLLWNDADDNPDQGFQPVTAASSGKTILLAQEGDQVQVRFTASAQFNTLASTTLTIGDTSAAYNVTTCTLVLCYENGIFVATAANGGNDANPGSIEAPLASIQAAIDLAASVDLTTLAAICPGPDCPPGTGTRPAVYVSAGTYNVDSSTGTQIVMKEGVSVFGGFAAGWGARDPANFAYATWIKDLSSATGLPTNPNRAVEIKSGAGTGTITTATTLDGLVIEGGTGLYNNSVWIVDASPTISNNTILGGGGSEARAIEVTTSSGTSAPVIAQNWIGASSGTPRTAAGRGIRVSGAGSSPTISGNTFNVLATNTAYGIYATGGSPSISGNTFTIVEADAAGSGDCSAIEAGSTTSLTVSNNAIDAVQCDDVAMGISANGGTVSITGNTTTRIASQTSGSPVGVSLVNATITVSGNTISGVVNDTGGALSTNGLYLNKSSGTVSGNTIHGGTTTIVTSVSSGIRVAGTGSATLTIGGATPASGNTIQGGSAYHSHGIFIDGSTAATIVIQNNLSIRGGTGTSSAYGIENVGAVATITGNNISGGTGGTAVYGIVIDRADGTVISNNVIDAGVATSAGQSFGIDYFNNVTATGVTISGNTIMGGSAATATHGIRNSDGAFGATKATITGNTIFGGKLSGAGSGSSYGIRMVFNGQSSGTDTIRNNTIHGGENGSISYAIAISDWNATIQNNTMGNSGASGSRGVRISTSSLTFTIAIENNIIVGTDFCVYELGLNSDPDTLKNNDLLCTTAYVDEGTTGSEALLTVAGLGALTVTSVSGNISVNPALEDSSSFNKGTLNYSGQTVNFTNGQTLTGGSSGATAVILSDTDAGTTGTLTLVDIKGLFQDGETITGSGGVASTKPSWFRFFLRYAYATALPPSATADGTVSFVNIWQPSTCSTVNFSGLDLSLQFLEDKAGTTRTAPWGMGAYEEDGYEGC